MSRIYKERLSDSPYIEKIAHFCVEEGYSHTCAADVHSNMLIVTLNGKTFFTVWGPETKSGLMRYPTGAEFLIIRFKFGSFMPHMPNRDLVDTGVILPEAGSKSFWLNSSAWQFPDYENADTFVDWLVHEGLLMHDTLVDTVLQDHPHDLSLRSTQRRFLRATGLTRNYVRRLAQAQQATELLQRGVSILDTVDEAGYFDQPHLTRALKHFIGQTPAEIARMRQLE